MPDDLGRRKDAGSDAAGEPLSWPFGSLTPFKYGAILADPPWSYEMWSAKGYDKSPEAHYSTMADEDLMKLPVEQLASPDGCFLFMWAVYPKLEAALSVMRAWGFSYKTGGAWHKVTSSGKTAFGTGYIVRSACEPFLIGVRGKPRAGSRSVRNLIMAERREHSRKPPAMRENVEKLCPSVWRCELFAREPWANNEVWGNEPTRFDR